MDLATAVDVSFVFAVRGGGGRNWPWRLQWRLSVPHWGKGTRTWLPRLR